MIVVCSRKIICLLGVFLYPRLAHMLFILTSRYSFYSSPPCWHLELWPCSAAGQPPSNLWDQRDWPVETPLPWDRGETEAGWDKWELAVHQGTGPRSLVVLIPNLFLSKLLNLGTLYDYFLYPDSVLYHSYWTCELQLDWVAHGNRNLTLSVLVSFSAFLYCWLQILLGRIRPLPEMAGEVSNGGNWQLQDPPPAGTSSCLDTFYPQTGSERLPCTPAASTQECLAFLKRADKKYKQWHPSFCSLPQISDTAAAWSVCLEKKSAMKCWLDLWKCPCDTVLESGLTV